MQMQASLDKCHILTLNGGHNGGYNCDFYLFVILSDEILMD